MEKLQINFGNVIVTVDLLKELGKGAFGTVHLASDERGKNFAIKRSQCIDNATYYAATQEIQILMNLHHENIARMFAFDFQNNAAVIAMEYCHGGNLNTRLNSPVDSLLKILWINQLIDALAYLHDKKIVHRDLKPENVLLSKNNDLKVTDFGISRFYFKRSDDADDNQNLSEYVEAFMGTFVGTPYWVAPEVFDRKYDEKADLFSLGVICYAILHGEFMVYEDVKYYGAFVEYQGNQVGLGVAMVEQNMEIAPRQHYDENNNVDYLVCNLLRRDTDKRMSLVDAKELVNKAPTPPSVVVDVDEEDEAKPEPPGQHKVAVAYWPMTVIGGICNWLLSWFITPVK